MSQILNRKMNVKELLKQLEKVCDELGVSATSEIFTLRRRLNEAIEKKASG